jgi:hypothetical protein
MQAGADGNTAKLRDRGRKEPGSVLQRSLSNSFVTVVSSVGNSSKEVLGATEAVGLPLLVRHHVCAELWRDDWKRTTMQRGCSSSYWLNLLLMVKMIEEW